MLLIIILLLVAIIAIMLFGRAAIMALAVAVLGYLALVLVGSVFAITMSEMLGSETAAYVAATIAFVVFLFALWSDADLKARNAATADLLQRSSSQIDVTPNDPADDKPSVTIKKDRLVGRIGRERLKPQNGVALKRLVGRFPAQGKDIETPRD